MRRREKVARALMKELNIIIHDELKDPRLGIVSITHLEISSDLRQVRAFFSVLGQEKDFKLTKEALDSARGYIRHLVSQRMRLKFTPEIIFREDRSTQESIKIQEIIDQIHLQE